ncbi:MAG: CapA family protein [Actinobacteria bacterium]|nr:CapA family protein [Actinomycetota bacterium]
MLGRGINQILPHPGDPTLREGYLKDARGYIELAERINGPIPRPADPTWPWGEAIAELDAADVRVINLETSITRSDDFAPGKAVHYRMHPDNLAGLMVARPDVCVLANNHVLDFGRGGLAETLEVLGDAGLRTAGAGRDLDAARRPAVVPLEGDGRVLVFGIGMASSGIPASWAAGVEVSGVRLVGPSTRTAADVIEDVQQHARAGDVVVASIHWGSNWGYTVPAVHERFARALIDGGVDVVHGHSSHHPRPIEVYRDRLILYGCGDFIDDYEGISGYEDYRDDLRPMYLATLDPGTGALRRLRLVVLQARRMRLEHATDVDRAWLTGTLARISRRYGSRVVRGAEGQPVLDLRSPRSDGGT